MTWMMIKYLFVLTLIATSSCTSRKYVACQRPVQNDVELSINGASFIANGVTSVHDSDSLLAHAYLANLDTGTFLSFLNILGNYIKIPTDRINEIPVNIGLYTKSSIHAFNTDSLTGILIIMMDTVKGRMHSLLFRNDSGKGFSEIEVFNNVGYYYLFNELFSISPIVFDGANWAYFILDRKPALTGPKKSILVRRSIYYKPLRKYTK